MSATGFDGRGIAVTRPLVVGSSPIIIIIYFFLVDKWSTGRPLLQGEEEEEERGIPSRVIRNFSGTGGDAIKITKLSSR